MNHFSAVHILHLLPPLDIASRRPCGNILIALSVKPTSMMRGNFRENIHPMIQSPQITTILVELKQHLFF